MKRLLEIMRKDIAATKETPVELPTTTHKSHAVASRWWHNIFPALIWLRSYKPQWLRADLIAGVTLAAYLMPAGLALSGGRLFVADSFNRRIQAFDLLGDEP